MLFVVEFIGFAVTFAYMLGRHGSPITAFAISVFWLPYWLWEIARVWFTRIKRP